MSIINDCVQFLEDLILGDFNGQQMVSAQVVGGLISLIPVMDQVMDARDISGCLYRINKRGGFPKAKTDDKVDLGFAAFGVVPAVGSAFKTVFKPLYKQRKAAKGVVNNGVAMIERMLGHRKGGAVRWVKTMDWAGNTKAAIMQADMALESCISLLEYLAQTHWWCPDRLELLSRDVAPALRSMRGKLAAPIREAATEIREFLEDLLGEHAAAVAMSVAIGAMPTSRGSVKAGHAGLGVKSVHNKVAGKPRIHGKTTTAGVVNSVQRTAYQTYPLLANALKGLIGEHICEHHVIEDKRWGLSWNRHDMPGGAGNASPGWQSEYRKINDDEVPIFLCTPMGHVNKNGIDSAWFTNRKSPQQFAIVEAKASMSAHSKLINLLSDSYENSAPAPSPSGRRKKGSPRAASSVKRTPSATRARVLQMSRPWIDQRLRGDHPEWAGRALRNYSRHVLLVTPLQAAEHIIAAEKIIENGCVSNPLKAQKFAHLHDKHKVQKEFKESDLVAAEAEYRVNGKPSRNNGRNK
ncbi:hypothetical protein IFU01_04600 [Oxalobacteraceae sp. CFBP 8763]|nr:hypothetical protein [Oxalobacteraceae sp. CFBP 8763]